MAQKRTERKRQSKVAKETSILQLVRSMHLKTAALDTPRVARQHCMISHHFGTYPDSSMHLPVEVVANYCSALHTLPIQASTPFIYSTSITLSQL